MYAFYNFAFFKRFFKTTSKRAERSEKRLPIFVISALKLVHRPSLF